MIKNPPAKARGIDLIPGPERFHMTRNNEAPELQPLKPVALESLPHKRSPCSETPPRLESTPPHGATREKTLCLVRLESSLCSSKDPAQPKINE